MSSGAKIVFDVVVVVLVIALIGWLVGKLLVEESQISSLRRVCVVTEVRDGRMYCSRQNGDR